MRHPARLRADAIDTITDPDRHVYYSVASVWELELATRDPRMSGYDVTLLLV